MGLPMSRQCSTDAHAELIADGLLEEDECEHPEDLSALADAVYGKYDVQKPLVERLPRGRFRSPTPNEGCLLTAALLRERALDSVITLNFDRGLQIALANLGAGADVAIIAGPEAREEMGGTNLIYLHRSVDADPEEWILRSIDLEEAWEGQWEEAMAQRLLAVPVTVFAGLGTAAGVLVDAVERLRGIFPEAKGLFLVDPGELSDSEFAAALALDEGAYVQLGWCLFMKELAQRLVVRFVAELEASCNELIDQEGWNEPDPSELCRRFGELSLLEFGRIRARWLLDAAPYSPHEVIQAALLADLLLAVGVIERATGSVAEFHEDGVVAFRRGDDLVTTAIFASGHGTLNWETMEAKAASDPLRERRVFGRPRFAIFAGAREGRPSSSAPANLVAEPVPDDIAETAPGFESFSVSELRDDETVIERMAA